MTSGSDQPWGQDLRPSSSARNRTEEQYSAVLGMGTRLSRPSSPRVAAAGRGEGAGSESPVGAGASSPMGVQA